jgi:hypothetical protein
MVLNIAVAAVNAALPSNHYFTAAIAVTTILVVRALIQGRKTNRERDLHARIVLVTVSKLLGLASR